MQTLRQVIEMAAREEEEEEEEEGEKPKDESPVRSRPKAGTMQTTSRKLSVAVGDVWAS